MVQFDRTVDRRAGRYLLEFKEPFVHGAISALAGVELRHLLEEGPRAFWAHFAEELDVVVGVEASHF